MHINVNINVNISLNINVNINREMLTKRVPHQHLRMLAFIRLPVPPASNTNPTSPISGVAKSASPFAALNLVINGAWFVDTNAEAEMELNAKINEKIADFMLARVSTVPN